MEDLEDRLRTWLATWEPGSCLVDVRSLSGGISSGMTAFGVAREAGTRTLVLRQPNDWTLAHVPNAVRAEFGRLEALRRLGIPAPVPRFCDGTGAHFGRPGMVLDHVEGAVDLRPTDLLSCVEQLARMLAAIHEGDTAAPGLALPIRPDRGFARFGRDDPPAADPAYQVERIWGALAERTHLAATNPPVLLHGDYWPGNTLWQDGQLVAVIDWEQAAVGDPLRDLAIGRLDLWWIFGPEAMAAFTERYRSHRSVDTAHLPLWDLWSALRPVSCLAEWAASYPALGRPDITAEYMLATHAGFVAQAFKALEAAGI